MDLNMMVCHQYVQINADTENGGNVKGIIQLEFTFVNVLLLVTVCIKKALTVSSL